MTEDMTIQKKRLDVRLQYILSLLVGYVLLRIFPFITSRVVSRLGIYTAVSLSLFQIFSGTFSVICVLAGIAFSLTLYRDDGYGGPESLAIPTVVSLMLEALLILLCLPFAPRVIGFFDYNSAVVAEAIPFLRAAALAMLVFSAASAVVMLTVKKKSFLMIALIDLAVFVLASLVMVVAYRFLNIGGVSVALGVGMLQPVAVLLPNLGSWDRDTGAWKAAPTISGSDLREVTRYDNTTGEMICPGCGARFPAGFKFCEQCGSKLNELRQPVERIYYHSSGSADDAPSGGYAVLSFFLPLVGLILYLVWRKRLPRRAGSAGKGALAGVLTCVALAILAILAVLTYMRYYGLR